MDREPTPDGPSPREPGPHPAEPPETAGAPDAPAPAVPPADRILPLGRMYLFAVASFGLYLPYWVWRRARLARVGGGDRATPVWWAVASLMAPVAWAVLYDLARDAAAGRPPGGRRVPVGLPAASCLAISVLLLVSPLKALTIGWLLLVPLPFLMVQGAINAGLAAGTPVLVANRFRALRGLGVGAGLVAFAVAVYLFDASALSRWLSRPLAVRAAVSGASETYELTVPGRGWRRVSSGTVSEDEADLELTGPGLLTWLVVYLDREPVNDLDAAVQLRREMIFSAGQPSAFEEQRHFLDEMSYAPVSVVDYRVDFPFAQPDLYVVLTARIDAGMVEVVGYTADPKLGAELRELVLSFRVPQREGSS